MTLDLDVIEKLLAEATPGPWEAYVTPGVVAVTKDEHRKAVIGWLGFDAADYGPRATNARLIVALRNAAPELLRLARRGQASDDPRGAPPTAPASPSADELAAFAQEFADEPCTYGDNCPTFGTRHGTCTNCRARALLARRRSP